MSEGTTRYLGLDVHKATITVAVAEESGPPAVYGTIATEPATVRKLVRQLGREARLVVAYEAAATVVLDEVKRSRRAPSGAIELLIATSLQEMRGQAARASLGLAPITGIHQSARLAAAEALLRRVLGMSSVSPGLHAFKAKFNPGWEPRYLVVERWTDLAPVLLAAFLLHYPEAIRRSWGRGTQPRPASR